MSFVVCFRTVPCLGLKKQGLQFASVYNSRRVSKAPMKTFGALVWLLQFSLKVLSREMDPAEIRSSLKSEARRFLEKSARSPCCESPLKLQRYLVQLLLLETSCQRRTQICQRSCIQCCGSGSGIRDSGSGAFLTLDPDPGSGIGFLPDPGSQTHIF
jgi:hypothetical protein